MPKNNNEFAIIIESDDWIEFRCGILKDLAKCEIISIPVSSLEGYDPKINMARLIAAAERIALIAFDEIEDKIKKHREILKILDSVKTKTRPYLSARTYVESFEFKSGVYYLYSVDTDSSSVFVGNPTHYARYQLERESLTLFEGEAIEMTKEEEENLHYVSLLAIRTANLVFSQRLYEAR